jgi:LuxR family transcriptional regulator, maltose regulon positive regulatory protein
VEGLHFTRTAGEHRRVAWVALDRFDDDPAVLLTLPASAFARISPGNSDLIADMRGLGCPCWAAPRLASALRTSPVPFVLMLDDLHELRSPACHDVLGALHQKLGVSSRSDAVQRAMAVGLLGG